MTSNKYILLFVLSTIMLTNWHCSNKIEGFDMVYRAKFPRDIPSSVSTLLSHNFVIENISSNATDFYASHNVTDAEVLKIIPKSARILAVFNDADFIFVNRVYVYVYPVGEPNKKTEVFYREDIPLNTGAAINLTGGVADVKKIVGTDNFTMEVRLDVRGQPSRNIETAIDFSFYAVTKD